MLKLLERDDSHEFQPILAEIEDRPINPLGKTIFWLVVLIILFFSIWMCFGQIDIIVPASGEVIPEGQVKVLQSFDEGVVKKILIQEGDFVRKGQVLIEIDPATTEPKLSLAKNTLAKLNLENNRLTSQLSGAPFNPSLQGATSEDVSTQVELYSTMTSGLKSQLESKKEALNSITEQIKSASADVEHFKSLLNTSLEKQSRLLKVIDIIAKDDYSKTLDDISTFQSNISDLTYKLKDLNHQKDQLSHEIAYLKQNFQAQTLKELNENQKQEAELGAQLQDAAFRHSRQKIIAPVDGYIDSLSVHTVGGVVKPVDNLVSLVPDTTPLIIKATILNKDIGFISKGMPVSIKIDTYDFQKYGSLNGKVEEISRNSKADQKNGLVYSVDITPIEHTLQVEGKSRSLSPGMSVTAEIVVGKRRIIEFFIYPLIKYLHDGISVR